MACVAGDAYHPSGGADQFGVMVWLFGMVLAVIAYLLMVGLIALFINETKITLIGLASLVGLVIFFKVLNVASDWGLRAATKKFMTILRDKHHPIPTSGLQETQQ